MTLDQFLNRLDKVKRNGERYLARCPAHEDRSPSLSITEGDDGRILVHCFGGCQPADIVGSMGLELKDLFLDSGLTAEQRQEYALQRRREELDLVVGNETLILLMAKAEIEKGNALSDVDVARVAQAERRIKAVQAIREGRL